jgi:hypothetical protein
MNYDACGIQTMGLWKRLHKVWMYLGELFYFILFHNNTIDFLIAWNQLFFTNQNLLPNNNNEKIVDFMQSQNTIA